MCRVRLLALVMPACSSAPSPPLSSTAARPEAPEAPFRIAEVTPTEGDHEGGTYVVSVRVIQKPGGERKLANAFTFRAAAP